MKAKARKRKDPPSAAGMKVFRNVMLGLCALILVAAAARELWRRPVPSPSPPPVVAPAPAPAPTASVRMTMTNIAVAHNPSRDGTEQKLTLRTAPNASCNVGLSMTADKTVDEAPGLGPKQANFQGDIEWTWTSEFPPFAEKDLPVMMRLEIVCDGAKAEHFYTVIP